MFPPNQLARPSQHLASAAAESWRGFVERFANLANRVGLSEPLQVAWILEKLPPKLQMALNTLSITNEITLQGIINVVERIQVKDLDMSINAAKKARAGNKKKRWCRLHKKCGHTTEECRALRSTCKKNALITDDDSNKGNSLCAVPSPFCVLATSRARFVIKVRIGKLYSVSALLDTGADVSCIDAALARKMRVRLSSGDALSSFNGTRVKSMGYARHQHVEIDTHSFTTDFIVIQNLIHPIIIGGSLLKAIIKELGMEKLFGETSGNIKTTTSSVATIDVASKYQDVFSEEISGDTRCKLGPHHIDTCGAQPLSRGRFRIGAPQEAIVEEEVQRLLKAKVIRPSRSPWSSATVLVKKKDGTPRLCIDYRPLNEVTVRDAYPLPRIDEILDSLSNARVFSTLDATSGYHQIPVAPKDIPKTAFQTRSGLYEFVRMPFGLVNAPATFQRIMDEVLENERNKFVQVYLDDIIVYSRTREEHAKHLETVLNRIKDAGMKLKKSKCSFFKDELQILGFRVKENEISPPDSRVQDIRDFPLPKTTKELRSFLGLTSYCRSFIKDLAKVALPLTDVLKGNPSERAAIKLSQEATEAFESIKKSLSTESKLRIPDYNRPFILTTDASSFAIGAVLSQLDDRKTERPVSFFSQKLTSSQANYSATQRELLAVVESMRFFKPYLLHKRFTLRTDHQALTALKSTRNQNSMLLRWSLFLSEFSFDVEYIRGTSNPADVLSRINTSQVAATCKAVQDIETEDARKEILTQYHLELGHGSAGNMIYNLRKKYTWPNMYTEVKNFVKQCEICLKAGGPVRSSGCNFLKTRAPAEILEIDIVGPMQTTSNGNRYLITLVDHYSKYAVTKAAPSKSADEVYAFIRSAVLPVFPRPAAFLSDNGREFTAGTVQALKDSLGAKWMFGAPFHPQTQGAVERFNGTILTKIKKLSSFGLTEWDLVAQKATDAYNASFHRALGCSPRELLLGSVPKFSPDATYLPRSRSYKVPITMGKRIRERVQSKYETEFSNKTSTSEFTAGDKVMRFIQTPHSKLDAKWDSGYLIAGKFGKESYIVTKNNMFYRVNKSHLKLDTSESSLLREGGNVGHNIPVHSHAPLLYK